MKTIIRFYKWIIISVILQVIILSYFNFYYLNREREVKSTSFEFEYKNESVKLPKGADDIRVSYDGTYVSYLLDGDLKIMDIEKKKELDPIHHKDYSFSYYRWLPDRNILIYALKPSDANLGKAQVVTYDVDSKRDHFYPAINYLLANSEVIDIELSPLTNVVYVNIKVTDDRIRIYKFNIMDRLSFIMRDVEIKTIFKEMNYEDQLVYQASDTALSVRNGNGAFRSIPFSKKVKLLEIDAEDRIYVGELNEEEEIVSIQYGELTDKPEETWKKITLADSVYPEKLVITYNGNVYKVQSEEKSVVNVKTGTEISFKGELVEILDNHIVSRENSKLGLTVLK